MNISLHIERLVLDSAMDPRARRAFQSGLERELTRLLTSQGLDRAWTSGAAFPQLRVDAVQWKGHEGPADMGAQVARTVYRGLSQPEKP